MSPHQEIMRITLAVTDEDRRIAWLASVAVGLSVAEGAIPSPLPGIKPGLANIVTLVVLDRFGWRVAAWVSLLRVVAGAILAGTFLSPTFVLSLAGAVAALAALLPARALPATWFGPVSHSVLAAGAHMGAQLAVVCYWLMPHVPVAALLPLFLLAALVFGAVNGIIASVLLGQLAQGEQAPA
jgi:heptaprenyl diphosphate synthase